MLAIAISEEYIACVPLWTVLEARWRSTRRILTTYGRLRRPCAAEACFAAGTSRGAEQHANSETACGGRLGRMLFTLFSFWQPRRLSSPNRLSLVSRRALPIWFERALLQRPVIQSLGQHTRCVLILRALSVCNALPSSPYDCLHLSWPKQALRSQWTTPTAWRWLSPRHMPAKRWMTS